MRNLFHTELDRMQQQIVHMGHQVAAMVEKATRALAEQNADLARQVIAQDDEIDALLIEIELKCMQLLALQQPMARDLRTIGTGIKIVTDLERIADHATNIAGMALKLEGQPLVIPLVRIPRMAELAQSMIGKALAAFVQQDEKMARTMIEVDHQVDRLYREVFDEMLHLMSTDPAAVVQCTHLLHVAVYLERIGDHATNLGEWTIYMLTGTLEELNN
jgi:phosphate transport system protein